MATVRQALRELALEEWEQGSLYAGRDVSFARALGLTLLGASYGEVPPGKSACPFHNHRCEDELFVVLEGSGLYRFGEARIEFTAGDVLAAPAGGPETAHQLVNTGSSTLRYLAISNRSNVDVIDYPDSGKRLVKLADGSLRSMHRPAASLDYWDGEPGAS